MLFLLSFAFGCCGSKACVDVAPKSPPNPPQLPTSDTPQVQPDTTPPPRSSRAGEPIQIEDVDLKEGCESSSLPPRCGPPQRSRNPFLAPKTTIEKQPLKDNNQSNTTNSERQWMMIEFGWTEKECDEKGMP